MSGTNDQGIQRPNVVVIMTDQQKATAIDLYGGPVRTPHLSRLAAQGTLYERAFTPHPLCVPARIAFWTGRWPHTTGARTNEIPMPRGETHLPQLLHGAGYRLGHFGKNHCFTADDFDRYFDRVFLAGHSDRFGPDVTMVNSTMPGTPTPAALSTEDGFRRPVARLRAEPPEESATYRVVDEACHFLEQHATGQRDAQPLFLWVSIPDPHEPYQVPQRYAAQYPPKTITLPPWRDGELASKPERQRIYHRLLRWDNLTEDDARLAMSVYYGMIAFIDEQVGRLLDTLERLVLRDDTIVVFTSDHGDFMGEHHLLIKCNAFYDCLTRVPLILSYPRQLAGGTRRPEPVSLVDVMPTILSLVGLPTPPQVQGQMLPGVFGAPYLPTVAGERREPSVPDAPPAREATFAEYGAGGPVVTLTDIERLVVPGQPRTLHPLLREREAQGHAKMVRTSRWKYTYDAPMPRLPGATDSAGDEELYDLDNDPWELTNLAGEARYRDVVSEMRRHLVDWLLQTENPRPVPLYFHPFWAGSTPPASAPGETDTTGPLLAR